MFFFENIHKQHHSGLEGEEYLNQNFETISKAKSEAHDRDREGVKAQKLGDVDFS